MSTKLKLLGVDVALVWRCAGWAPRRQSYQWTDGPRADLQKIVVSQDGKALLAACWWGMPATAPRCCR
ncbi:hypothetical protein LNP74_28705 [Klebsiella pneumoniae subsp. pneumoniae]|nr:hypothetical protein [Klebsiella pneumoniae subsp. pneumoniae]